MVTCGAVPLKLELEADLLWPTWRWVDCCAERNIAFRGGCAGRESNPNLLIPSQVRLNGVRSRISAGRLRALCAQLSPVLGRETIPGRILDLCPFGDRAERRTRQQAKDEASGRSRTAPEILAAEA